MPSAVLRAVGAVEKAGRGPLAGHVRTAPGGFVSDNGDPRICATCTFRPWAQRGEFERAEAIVDGVTRPAQCMADAGRMRCTVSIDAVATTVEARVYDHDGNFGTQALP